MTEDNKAKLQGILGDKYDVQDMIYRGGMGEIYLGLHKQLGAKVAIKIMIQKLTDDPELKKRFHREAQLYANLRHPNIIHIYDFGSEDAFDYMVFPFIDGETLQEKIERAGKLDEEECLNIMISIGKALAYAGENNVIHRDVKPSNIMIEGNGNVLIADFGISKNLEDIDITLPGTVLGSPKYMSPEQVLGKEADSRSDQYALGIIFFEMLSGKFPFEGTTPSALFYSHVNEVPELPEDTVSGAHHQFPEIINKLIAKEPDDRYENFNELIDDLTLIQLEETQIRRQVPGVSKKKTGSKKHLMLAAGLAVILIAGIAGVFLLKPAQEPVAPPKAAIEKPAPKATEKATQEIVEALKAPAEPTPEPVEITVATIKDMLFNFGKPDQTALYQISTNKSSYNIGDQILYTIKARKDCHVILLDFSTSDELIQLFPNQFNPDTFIRANTVYNIPSQGYFEVTGPAGSETVIGYADDATFDLMGKTFESSPFLMITDKDTSELEKIYKNIQNLKTKKLIRKNIDFIISD